MPIEARNGTPFRTRPIGRDRSERIGCQMKVDQCLAAPQFTWRRNVTECTNLQNAVTLEMPVPDGASSLESILLTEELLNRPWRPPDHETENSALVALTRALADSPRTILQTLSEKVLDILHVDSAGLSLVTKDKKSFHWPAIAGAWRPHIGGGTPRHFGPCGDVLDRCRWRLKPAQTWRHVKRKAYHRLPRLVGWCGRDWLPGTRVLALLRSAGKGLP